MLLGDSRAPWSRRGAASVPPPSDSLLAASLEDGVRHLKHRATSGRYAIEALFDELRLGLPSSLDAFFELHSARRRWVRADVDLAHVVPSILIYVEHCQALGFFRKDPSHWMASMLWWFLMGALGSHGRNDTAVYPVTFHALKRLLLTPESLSDAAIDEIEIVVDEPHDPAMLRRPWTEEVHGKPGPKPQPR
ncbi:MAG: hypothetical protein IPJ65_25500 [Archangiaceae bacterium]|nr:hypothetical protein [Archangiaceae bacterium]